MHPGRRNAPALNPAASQRPSPPPVRWRFWKLIAGATLAASASCQDPENVGGSETPLLAQHAAPRASVHPLATDGALNHTAGNPAVPEPEASVAPAPEAKQPLVELPPAEDSARGRAFTPAQLDLEELKALLNAHPRTRHLQEDLAYFWDPHAGIKVLGRGTNNPKGFEFEAGPKIWRPGARNPFLIVVGRSGKSTSFIVVYRILSEGQATLESSYIMENEEGPLALGFSQAVRNTAYFTRCWGCPGETGKILLKENGRAVIVQP